MHREPYEEVQEAPEDAEETSPVDAALEEAGFNAVSVEVLLITGLGWFADGLETSALSVLLPALATEFSATAGELAAFASAVAAGQAVGAFGWGAVADARGRRGAFVASLALAASVDAAAGSAPSFDGSSLKALAGVGCGGNLPIAVTLASELLPPRRRETCGVGPRPPRSSALSRDAASRAVLMHVFYELGELSAIGLAALLLRAAGASSCRCWARRRPSRRSSARFACPSQRWLWRGDAARAARWTRRAAAARPHARRQAPRRRVERRGRRGPAPLGPPGDDGDDGLLLVRAPGASFLAPRRSRTRRAAQVGSGWVTWAPEIAATRDLRSGPTYAVLAAARVLACTVFLPALVERHGPWPTLLGFLACTTAASGGLAALLARRSTTTELRFGAAYCADLLLQRRLARARRRARLPTDGAGFGAANVGAARGRRAAPRRRRAAPPVAPRSGSCSRAAGSSAPRRRSKRRRVPRAREEDRADGVDADSPLV
ncbi:N-methylnicotinate transmembrane transporter [Aureococcus anophagefferens]|nr:N-methylnicotinate transmembrane transporter [Aureococcus anophagefferens]